MPFDPTPDERAASLLNKLAEAHEIPTPLWDALHTALSEAIARSYAEGVSDTYLAVRVLFDRTPKPH